MYVCLYGVIYGSTDPILIFFLTLINFTNIKQQYLGAK